MNELFLTRDPPRLSPKNHRSFLLKEEHSCRLQRDHGTRWIRFAESARCLQYSTKGLAPTAQRNCTINCITWIAPGGISESGLQMCKLSSRQDRLLAQQPKCCYLQGHMVRIMTFHLSTGCIARAADACQTSVAVPPSNL